MIELRYYQQEAKEAFYNHLRTRDDSPCVVIPTAGGKTPLMASICADAVRLWQGRVLVLAHVKELLEQTASKLQVMCPDISYGVYSASLKKREKDAPVVIAGIQSVYRRACEMDAFDLILVDEAHLIPLDGDGMYRQFLKDAKVVNPDVRVGGLTATPYRLKTGSICGPDAILNHICYEIGVRELIVKGFISRVTSKASLTQVDTSGVHVQGGEYIAGELEEAANRDDVVEDACEEIIRNTKDRKAVLVFTCGIAHGEHVARVLRERTGEEVNFVAGQTPVWQRDEWIDRYRDQDFKWLVNVNVLSTGFDATHIDCVALLRPTLSPGLFYQMCGRGFRLHPGKENCLVLDFGGNVLRHGPVDRITSRVPNAKRKPGEGVHKVCPQCQEVMAAGCRLCPACAFEFPAPEVKHDAEASTESILSGEKTTEVHKVDKVTYRAHLKKGADENAPRTMRVDYHVGYNWTISEWVCFEHEGFARKKAITWWVTRSRLPVPSTVQEAIQLANRGALAETVEITVCETSGEKFPRITGHTLGPIPAGLQPEPEPQEEDWLSATRDAADSPFPEDAMEFPFGANDPLDSYASGRTPSSFDDEEIPF